MEVKSIVSFDAHIIRGLFQCASSATHVGHLIIVGRMPVDVNLALDMALDPIVDLCQL